MKDSTSLQNNAETLMRVGAGTPMGDLMRQYWIPAAMGRELDAGGAPLRLMLLGEKLVAFRDTDGRVGIMDHRCPHRCTSLFLGRNEEAGLRCVYHGWKFDVEGNCVDAPSVPASHSPVGKVKTKAYKTVERNGLVWVFMGDQDNVPALPMIEANMAPEDEVSIQFVQRQCNWMQSLEGDIDTAHFGFLHAGNIEPDDLPDNHPLRPVVAHRAPAYNVAETPWGTSYGAHREHSPGHTAWRVANFLFPFWTQAPNADLTSHVGIRAWVPMDDEHTMVVWITWIKHSKAYSAMPMKSGKPLPGYTPKIDFQPNDTGWHGRFRPVAREDNDWTMDRGAQQRNEIYTGIQMIFLQDQAVTESMGELTDHAFEHLTVSDQMIGRTRRRLLNAARALREDSTPPPGAREPQVYWQARSGSFVVSAETDWQDAYTDLVAKAVRAADAAQA